MALHQIFFLSLIILLPTQLGYHFWPEWAYVLGRRVDYLSPTVYLTDVIIFFIILFWLIEGKKRITGYVSRVTVKKVISIIHNTKYVIPVVIFVLLNIFFAASRPVAILKWAKVLEFTALGYYIVQTKPSAYKIQYSLFIGVLYSSIIAMFQFFLQHSIGGPLWFLGERTFTVDTPGIARLSWCLIPGAWCKELLRPYATFPHPNVLGGFLAVTLPLLIFNRTKKFSMFMLTVIILAIVALSLTFSRSAILIGLGAIGLILWQHVQKQKHSLRFFSKIIALIVLTMFLLITYHFSRIASSQTDESITVRQQLNSAAVKIWQQSPLLGVGLGNFLVELPNVLPSRNIYFLQPVHNIYLLILAETGVVGIAIFFSIVWFILKRSKKLCIMYHLAFVILLILGLLDHYPLTIQQGQLLLTVVVGIAAIRTHRS